MPAGITMVAGVISVDATNKDDVVKVEIDALDSSTALDDRVRVSLQTPTMTQTVWFDRYKLGELPINKVVFNGFAGNDQFYNLTDIPSVARGHAGNDILVGGSGNDLLYGDGGKGNDTMFGNDGKDQMSGGNDADFMDGGANDDIMSGDDGNDTIYGQAGNDTISGQAGNDSLFGGTGNDTMHGGTDDDMMYGEQGNDVMYGGAGADKLFGGADDDYLNGSTQNQSINDGFLDTLNGGTGVDYFRFEEVGPLKHLEFLVSDFLIGVDHKP